jgi:hypothetical protein
MPPATPTQSDVIVIDVLAPQDGIVPTKEGNLYEEELERVVRLIRQLAAEGRAKRNQPPAAAPAGPGWLQVGTPPLAAAQSTFEPTRRGILIEGERGVGKTTFLRAVLATVNDTTRFPLAPAEAQPRVCPLPLLDPTLISGDRTFIATVIANILGAVERYGGAAHACDPAARQKRDTLNRSLEALHNGLKAEDEETWRSLTRHDAAGHSFVDGLLQMARGGIELAERFEGFCRAAADLLGADMLLQPIDDVDIAGAEAYTTLEAVRRYMTGPSLLPILAGDLDQFMAMLWERRLADEERGLKAREANANAGGGLNTRQEQLRDAAAQHLNKVLRPDHRLRLRPRREAMLRRGVLRVSGAAPLPVFRAGSDATALVPADACLIGQAEQALQPSADGFTRELLLPLIPNNTRNMVLALAVLGRLTRGELPPAEALRGLAACNFRRLSNELAAAEMLLTISEDGPSPTNLTPLTGRRGWAILANRFEGPIARLNDSLLTIANLSLSTWIAQEPRRALLLLGRIAHIIADSVGVIELDFTAPGLATQPLAAWARAGIIGLESPGLVELTSPARYGRVLIAHWTAEAIRHVTAKTDAYRNRHAARVRAYSAEAEARGSLPGSYPLQDTVGDELIPYADYIRTKANDQHSPMLPATNDRATGWWDSMAGVVLNLARTVSRTTTGAVIVIDPTRTLEVVALLVQRMGGVPTSSPDRRAAITDLIVACQTDRPSPHELPRSDETAIGAQDYFKPVWHGPEAPNDALVQALRAWVDRTTASGERPVPSAATVAAAHQNWLAALAHIDNTHLVDRVATVGGYLERCTAALIAASARAELKLIDPLITPGPNRRRYDTATLWTSLSSWSPDWETYSADEGYFEGHPKGQHGLRRPDGNLLRVIDRVRTCASADTVTMLDGADRQGSAANWAAHYLPLTTMLATCPLLRLHFSGPWRAQLSRVWSEGDIALPEGAPDAFTLLSGIPLVGDLKHVDDKTPTKHLINKLARRYNLAVPGSAKEADPREPPAAEASGQAPSPQDGTGEPPPPRTEGDS